MASGKKRSIDLICLEDQPLGGADNMRRAGEVILSGNVPEAVAPEQLAARVKQNRMGFRPAGFVVRRGTEEDLEDLDEL